MKKYSYAQLDKAFRLNRASFKHEGFNRIELTLSCSIEIGTHWYGNNFGIPKVFVKASSVDLKKLAFAILGVVLGKEAECFIPVDTKGLIGGFIIKASRPPEYPIKDIQSFSYKAAAGVKRYPWHPLNKKCNPLVELPYIGICVPPGVVEKFNTIGGLDFLSPHAISIEGYPAGLIKLARLLLDYANLENAPEEIILEVEGGFRGVAPLSYEICFERIDA